MNGPLKFFCCEFRKERESLYRKPYLSNPEQNASRNLGDKGHFDEVFR